MHEVRVLWTIPCFIEDYRKLSGHVALYEHLTKSDHSTGTGCYGKAQNRQFPLPDDKCMQPHLLRWTITMVPINQSGCNPKPSCHLPTSHRKFWTILSTTSATTLKYSREAPLSRNLGLQEPASIYLPRSALPAQRNCNCGMWLFQTRFLRPGVGPRPSALPVWEI